MKKVLIALALVLIAGVGFLYLKNRELFLVNSLSMAPNLLDKDVIHVDKGYYKNNAPKRGEVVVYHSDDVPSFVHVGRVVAVGGDKVSFQYRRLIVNAQPAEKSQTTATVEMSDRKANVSVVTEQLDTAPYQVWYLEESIENLRPDPIAVPPGHVLILADNRDEARDGRFYGTTPTQKLIGKATKIVDSPSQERIGKKLND